MLEQGVGDLRVRGEVEVGEQHQARAEEVELLGLRLLDLQHEVGAAPTRRRRSARCSAPAARKSSSGMRGAGARAALDEHGHVVHGELVHAVGRDRDAVLAFLELAGHADDEGLGHLDTGTGIVAVGLVSGADGRRRFTAATRERRRSTTAAKSRVTLDTSHTARSPTPVGMGRTAW